MKTGYCYLVGDILHFGHKLHLKNCKALCDILFVGVLSAKACMENKPCPVLPLHERIEAIRDLSYVDVAICQDEYSPLNNCKAIRPDILFESTSHKQMPANNFIESIGGKVFVMPYYSEQSSTEIKNKVRENEKDLACKSCGGLGCTICKP